MDRAEPDFGDGQSVGSQRTVKAGDGGGGRRPQSIGDSRKPPCRGSTDDVDRFDDLACAASGASRASSGL